MSIAGITVVHAIPGRVRLKIPQLRDNPELARDIQQRVSGHQGIRRIEANPLTGSLLVLYDPSELTSLESLLALSETLTPLFPDLDIGQIEAWMAASTNGTGAPSSLMESISTTLGALYSAVGKVTGNLDLKLLLPGALFVLGIRGLLIAEKVPVPAWYDLLWFSFGTFMMLNRPEGKGAQ